MNKINIIPHAYEAAGAGDGVPAAGRSGTRKEPLTDEFLGATLTDFIVDGGNANLALADLNSPLLVFF